MQDTSSDNWYFDHQLDQRGLMLNYLTSIVSTIISIVYCATLAGWYGTTLWTPWSSMLGVIAFGNIVACVASISVLLDECRIHARWHNIASLLQVTVAAVCILTAIYGKELMFFLSLFPPTRALMKWLYRRSLERQERKGCKS